MKYSLFVIAFSSWMLTFWLTGGTVDSPEYFPELCKAIVAGLALVIVWEINCLLFPEERD